MKYAKVLFAITAIISILILIYGIVLQNGSYITGGILFLSGPVGFSIGLLLRNNKPKFILKRSLTHIFLFFTILIVSTVTIIFIKETNIQQFFKLVLYFCLLLLVIVSGFFLLLDKEKSNQ